MRQIPNALTFLRILLAISGATALWLSYSWSLNYEVPAWLGEPEVAVRGLAGYALIAFLVAAATDWLDGFLARRFSAQTPLGALLDPIADKALIGGYLLVYTIILGAPVEIAVPVGAIIARDLIMTLARLINIGRPSKQMPVSLGAKLKTALAMIVTALPLIALPQGWHTNDILLTGWIAALWVTAALSLLTWIGYFTRRA